MKTLITASLLTLLLTYEAAFGAEYFYTTGKPNLATLTEAVNAAVKGEIVLKCQQVVAVAGKTNVSLKPLKRGSK